MTSSELRITTNLSLTDMFFNLATSLTAALLPNSDKLLRKASMVLIKMVGIDLPQQETQHHKSQFSQDCHNVRRKLKIRRTLQFHRINLENSVRLSKNSLFQSKSYQNFLQHHKLKYQSCKSRFSSRRNQSMGTIQENDEP